MDGDGPDGRWVVVSRYRQLQKTLQPTARLTTSPRLVFDRPLQNSDPGMVLLLFAVDVSPRTLRASFGGLG